MSIRTDERREGALLTRTAVSGREGVEPFGPTPRTEGGDGCCGGFARVVTPLVGDTACGQGVTSRSDDGSRGTAGVAGRRTTCRATRFGMGAASVSRRPIFPVTRTPLVAAGDAHGRAVSPESAAVEVVGSQTTAWTTGAKPLGTRNAAAGGADTTMGALPFVRLARPLMNSPGSASGCCGVTLRRSPRRRAEAAPLRGWLRRCSL